MAAKKSIDLKQFRHAVSLLKKKGLIRNVDARSAQPYYIRQGRTLLESVEKYDDVVSGKVEPVFLNKAKTSEYRKAGYGTTRVGKTTAILVPKSATEKVKVTRSGDVRIEHPSGMVRIKQMVPYDNIPQWLTAMSRNYRKIDARLPAHHKFFYKFFGHNSYSTFADIRLMIDAFRHGSTSGLNLMDKARESTRKQQNEVYQNIEILFWPDRLKYPEPQRRRSATSAAARKRYRRRTMDLTVGDNRRKANAEAEARRRAKMTPAEREEYREAAKARAKKSRNRRKTGRKKRS